MPSKRVSLKGRGSEIFFGDFERPSDTQVTSTSPSPTPQPTSATPDTTVETIATAISSPPDDSPIPAAKTTRTSTRRPSPRSGVSSGGASTPTTQQARQQTVSPASLQATTLPRSSASLPASVLASALAASSDTTVGEIRKIVRTQGKEVTYVRLTPDEKRQIAELIHAYKLEGVKTTETEIGRIAINYLLLDHREQGEQSVLARVLAALLA